MSEPGKALAGLVITASGVIVAHLPIPGAAQVAGKLLAAYGFAMFMEGIFGLPELNPQGSKISVTSTQASLPVIYGQRRVSHLVADVAEHGTNNSWLDTMVGVCIAGESGKGIQGIQTIYLYNDGQSDSRILTPTNTNTVTAGHTTNVPTFYYKNPDWHYRYSIGKGSDTQAIDARMRDIQPVRWDNPANFPHLEGRGIVTVYHGYFWDKDEEGNVWERGRPNDIQYDVRGALLYDPRYKTAGPDSDGWIWDRADNGSLISTDNHPGQNAALQLLDLLTSRRYGLGIPYSSRGATWGTTDEIDEQTFKDMAEHCDEPVTTVGLDPNVTVPRYTSNLILSTSDSHKSNIERLLGACNGMLVYEGGKFKLIPRKVTTPVAYEITESEIIGGISMVREGISVPNIITVRHPDEEDRENIRSWTWPYDAFDPSQNGFLEADNDIPNERTFDIPSVTSRIHAQHLAMLNLKEMREDVAIEVTCRESALQLSVGDVANVTYDSAGFDQKPFWVTGMELKVDNTITLQLKEYDASVYTLDPNADIPTVPSTNLPDPFTVTAPTNVVADCSAGYYINDGVFVPRISITWTHSTDEFAHEEELVYKKDTDSEWIFTGFKKKLADTAILTWEGNLEFGTAYDFGIVAWNRVGVRSAVAETASACTISEPTDVATTPTALTVKRLPKGQWAFRWLANDEAGTLAYIMRYQDANDVANWDAGTQVWYGFTKYALVDWRDLPVGRVRIMVKALSRFAVFSSGYAEYIITNQPEMGNPLDVLREQIRKRKFGDADGMASDVLTGDGGSVLIGSDAGTVGEDLLYLNTGISLLDLEPIEGASQVNRIIERPALFHLDTWEAPEGYTIYSVKYLSGGLSVQGAAVWDDEKSVIDAGTGSTAAPTTYAQTPAVSVNGDVITALLYLTESDSGGTLEPRTAAFATPTTLRTIEETGYATPAADDLPAYDDNYRVGYTFSLTSDKGGSYSITTVLTVWINGAMEVKDTNVHTGTLPEPGAAGTLYASVSGWPSVGGDDRARVSVTDINAAGNWDLIMSVGLLRWTEDQGGTPLYASMTPNNELAIFEVELIQT